MELIKISGIYLLNDTSEIVLDNVPNKISVDSFVAIGLEKTQAAENWEGTDYFNIIVLVRASDRQYYLAKIEHPADILSPKHIENEMNIK